MAALDEIHRDWTALGDSDPLWAVLTDRGKRNGGWDEAEFLATGAAEIDGTAAWLAELGVTVQRGRALDFGCGAGRLSTALTAHFDEVVGVDISEPMLAAARRLDRTGRVRYVHNTAADLTCLEEGSFDLVYTNLVLQHMPPAPTRNYLRELVRVARPGGALVIGIPDRTLPTAVGVLSRIVPHAVIRFVQRTLLGFPAAMRMHTMPGAEARSLARACGARLVASEVYEDNPHWRHMRHVIVKEPEAEAEAEAA
ncbi:2-polyprenyl-3-methyl-5-hydroxy-6-metoxy-1,4-benzoquinol methylase [Spinactinospora alkalitolerans]|uniref:2-polyprenyl-3-methyl-5-hydroxy-6-metoxy-1, 4-benzoquinol methylase n=1 Tax=Spinactinospora alkalitolerans TaxID=687207 RepID=A0A852U784_9ACTN|nr:class I SAM-dependent methyltransferase [Spinactinospora alkalitolerans]NYE49780.1 2-polyprenyl-3-methyl-5-hydroxy-6-metoxy-1,4-benzoquinol methylase [Spinactinospora alkalitolerans]